MTKRFLILSLSLIFLIAGLITPLADRAFSAPAPPASVDLAPASVPTGFYIANGQWNMLPAADYNAVGSFLFWSWESLNPGIDAHGDPIYRFDKIDSYITAAINAGYQSVGIAITTYNGRTAQYYPCTGEFNQGYAQTPYFVRWGPNGVDESSDGDADTGDDPVVIADDPDTRDCNGDGVKDPWLLPKYTDPYYKQQYRLFIEALADHLLNSPHRDRVAWVAIGAGKDGENIPVNNSDDESLLRVISVNDWVDFVKDLIDYHHDAFAAGAAKPQIPLLTQNAPFYVYTWERRDIAQYANSKGVGVSVNNITSDFDLTEAGQAGNFIGLYDQVRLFGDNVPIGLESYGFMMASENEYYWTMARALDLKPDFLRLSSFWNQQDTPVNHTITQWASRFIGKGFNAGQTPPPSIWSRMREHRDPVYLPYVADAFTANFWPSVGNYEYFLLQDHDAPHGVTIPITDDPRYQASDHRIGWDRVSGQPAHYNEHPYSAILNSAGLYHAASVKQNAVEVQIEADPGWTARRSDQASGNYGFFFNADDRYISAPANINAPHKIRITVTYLDHGNDRWRLMYDSTTGEKAARLYALQDWNVANGLAGYDGLPHSGVLPEPRPAYVQKHNTNHWKVAVFYIEDGYFGNRLPGGNDFYIDSRNEAETPDGDEYIHHVDVQRLNDAPQATPTSAPPTIPPTTTPTLTPTTTPAPGGNSISGYVFENKNDDYTKDPDEPGLPGALVSLYLSDNFTEPLAQTVSANDGFYSFNHVSPETYIIIVSPPAGWETMIASRYVVLEQGQSVTHQDFPARRVATPTPTPTPTPGGGRIYGVVFEDDNANGVIDSGEPGVADAALRLEDSLGQVVAETHADANGNYQFSNLPAQTYHLIITVPDGWRATTPADVILNPGVDEIEHNFGLAPPPPTGRLNAFVWNDLDKDGRKDADEPPLAGATVIILDSAGQTELLRKLTGGDGYARFDLEAPGNYLIREQPAVGMAASTPLEYTVIIDADTTVEIAFGNYDAFKKLYLPLLTRSAQ